MLVNLTFHGFLAKEKAKQRSYNEIIEFLDAHWQTNLNDKNLTVTKKLDQAFNAPSTKLNTVLVAGTNGKSITINFAAQLLREEGLKVGTFYSPHILTYNERFSINNEAIANKTFTELGNDVINMAESLGLEANSYEILTIMALLYFKNGEIVDKQIGAVPKSVLADKLNKQLA